jgi:chromosome segregation ATPase
MNLARTVAAMIGVWAVTSSMGAATLPDLERSLRDAVSTRARLVASRTQRITEASAAAAEISRLKARAETAVRADRELENRLQQFDRLSAGLDAADARLRDQDRLVARLRAEFDAAADAESRGLTEDRRSAPRDVASRLSEIDQARRRVEQLQTGGSDFRPVLDIRLAPSDTEADIDRKLPVIAAERERVLSELDRIAREFSVLEAREAVKTRLLQNLETAVREAPPDMRVLQRQADDVMQSLQEVNRQRQDLRREQRELRQALVNLDERRAECQARRRALMSRERPGGRE